VLLQINSDESTVPLRLAYSNDQVFPTGELVIEELSESGNLLRKTAFKMRSIVIDKLDILGQTVTLALKFENMTLAH
jgi:hypothetical protein